MSRDEASVAQHSSSTAKIALFRSLFRSREDVYPRRFESRKTGKSGYAPACANEWVRGICEKPRIKCAECPHRRFLPVTARPRHSLARKSRIYQKAGDVPRAEEWAAKGRMLVGNRRTPRPSSSGSQRPSRRS
jgi:hypothetical protein